MAEARYENGKLHCNGFVYSPVRDSLISRMVAVDKNIYSIKYFSSKLPKELQESLAGTLWVRVEVEKKNIKTNNNLVAVGL